MKKLSVICLLSVVLFLGGCSKKSENNTKNTADHQATSQTQVKKQATSESMVPSKTTSSTIVSSSNEEVPNEIEATVPSETAVEATTPELLRGTWIGNNGEKDLELTITENTIIYNDQTYLITSYSQSGNTYTISWDINSVSEPGNPQPFIYTYSPDTDEISSGITYHRK
ncbi:hypothetical protein GIX45_16765 [Erwinia sp. CPCC 100877]|nr:hypothetical protein [Erwinia sp. CPCC 100877]